MIIPALVGYYDRLEADPESDVAPYGFSRQQISFQVVLSQDGSHAEVKDARQEDNGKMRARRLVVPGQSKPSGAGINPCLLWDNAQYMLGYKPDDPKPERTKKTFEAFREAHTALEQEIDDEAFAAVCRFLRTWDPEAQRDALAGLECLTSFGVFRIAGEEDFVHERPAIRAWWRRRMESLTDGDTTAPGFSLVDGALSPIARLHEPKIKGVDGAQSSGATVVSFNQNAFDSYAKSQGFNAPVSEAEAFKYCTALNRLTGDRSRKVRVGDSTLVYWTERPSAFEIELLPAALSGSTDAEDAATAQTLRNRLASIARGKPTEDIDPETRCFVLGLAPNAARLSVRLWMESTVGALAEKLARHFEDMELQPEPEKVPDISVRRIVAETAPTGSGGWPDEKAVSPLLAGSVLRAILAGGPYPRALLTAVLARVRTEGLVDNQKRNDWMNAQHRRCAIIKACLVRNARVAGREMEVPVSLNEDHPKPAYHLGRLFAVLERVQERAFPREGGGTTIKSTIRDKYYGAASSTPASVFPRLLELKNHHIGKFDEHSGGLSSWFEKLIGEIIERIESFPRHHSMDEQGMFAIGYYHQRQEFFRKKDDAESVEPARA